MSCASVIGQRRPRSRTSVSTPSAYASFNPFAVEPVQGTNWNYAPTFGTALNRYAWTTPRTLQFGFGVRF